MKTDVQTTIPFTTRSLTCCVCGEPAGRYEQHWNRDTGYGICAACVAWLRGRGESEEEIKSSYGIEGTNFEQRSNYAAKR